jgi:hypothetical protein
MRWRGSAPRPAGGDDLPQPPTFRGASCRTPRACASAPSARKNGAAWHERGSEIKGDTKGRRERGTRLALPTPQKVRAASLNAPGARYPLNPKLPELLPASLNARPYLASILGTPRESQGTSATGGSASSRSASECRESAKRERAARTRPASSGGQLTKRTEQGARRAQARAASSARHFRMPFLPLSGFSAENPR